jgi:hypothetical protein
MYLHPRLPGAATSIACAGCAALGPAMACEGGGVLGGNSTLDSCVFWLPGRRCALPEMRLPLFSLRINQDTIAQIRCSFG